MSVVELLAVYEAWESRQWPPADTDQEVNTRWKCTF